MRRGRRYLRLLSQRCRSARQPARHVRAACYKIWRKGGKGMSPAFLQGSRHIYFNESARRWNASGWSFASAASDFLSSDMPPFLSAPMNFEYEKPFSRAAALMRSVKRLRKLRDALLALAAESIPLRLREQVLAALILRRASFDS
jgi:hypothetical protein